jgi:hypothetical protein
MNEKQKEWLQALASEHGVPDELATSMASLMEQYPDLSQWGSKADLKQELKKLIESTLKNKWGDME